MPVVYVTSVVAVAVAALMTVAVVAAEVGRIVAVVEGGILTPPAAVMGLITVLPQLVVCRS